MKLLRPSYMLKENLNILREDVNLVSFLIALDTVGAKKYS